MAIAYEQNTDLAFDTDVLRNASRDYAEVAVQLRTMASELNALLSNLAESGWTTPAGITFQQLAETDWEKNIEKYASLLDTLGDILTRAAQEYDGLMTNYVRKTKVNL